MGKTVTLLSYPLWSWTNDCLYLYALHHPIRASPWSAQSVLQSQVVIARSRGGKNGKRLAAFETFLGAPGGGSRCEVIFQRRFSKLINKLQRDYFLGVDTITVLFNFRLHN